MSVIIPKAVHKDHKIIMPERTGIEQRDLEHYPLPPDTRVKLVAAVCAELRSEGHPCEYVVTHERLVDWDATRKFNDRSWGWEDKWRPDPKGPMTLRFVSGGMNINVYIEDRTVRLFPRNFSAGRAGMKFVILGRF